MSNAAADLTFAVKEIADEMRERPDRGEVAHYIPELARVDPKHFGLVVIDAEATSPNAAIATRRSRSRVSQRSLR